MLVMRNDLAHNFVRLVCQLLNNLSGDMLWRPVYSWIVSCFLDVLFNQLVEVRFEDLVLV